MSSNVCDVFIAGAGPVGLAAAIALRLRGADVLIADALRPPIDKPCGEGLMPDARQALAELGVDLEPRDGARFAGISFISDLYSVAANFPSGVGIGVRRTVLHSLLLDRAASLGVRFRWNAPVALHPGQPATIEGNAVSYQWMIGADGSSSRVRAWAGLDSDRVRSRRFGFRAHYRIEPWSDHVEVHWGRLGQAYITPVGRDEICVSAMTRDAGVRLDQILASLPVLGERLAGAKGSSSERGCLTVTRRLRRVGCRNVALIGDASGSVDAITGEGLAVGFREALLLAESLSAGSLARYQAGHGRILGRPQLMAGALLLLDRHPRLRSRTLQLFASQPALFRSLLAFHVGESALPALMARRLNRHSTAVTDPSSYLSDNPASD